MFDKLDSTVEKYDRLEYELVDTEVVVIHPLGAISIVTIVLFGITVRTKFNL